MDGLNLNIFIMSDFHYGVITGSFICLVFQSAIHIYYLFNPKKELALGDIRIVIKFILFPKTLPVKYTKEENDFIAHPTTYKTKFLTFCKVHQKFVRIEDGQILPPYNKWQDIKFVN